MTSAIDTMEALEKRVGEDAGELSGLDRKLLKMAASRFSMERMSEELAGAMSPERCGQRVREIIGSTDWLSVVENHQLLLLDLVEIRDILFKIIRDQGGFKIVPDGSGGHVEVWVEGDPRWTQNLIRALEQMRKLVDSSLPDVDATKAKIKRGHALVMAGQVELAVRRSIGRFAEARGIDPASESELYEIVLETMPGVFRSLSEHTDEPIELTAISA